MNAVKAKKDDETALRPKEQLASGSRSVAFELQQRPPGTPCCMDEPIVWIKESPGDANLSAANGAPVATTPEKTYNLIDASHDQQQQQQQQHQDPVLPNGTALTQSSFVSNSPTLFVDKTNVKFVGQVCSEQSL
ncbi:hypothetical protein Tcan_05766 [Toxocara canis]|uniref:Uncharacterized protein n=1 Tax=Toxocara canis TaxID=6265 RepID=A0A0B2VZW7_TOXCA|nr:hypothetical protein Tcan_05766 [Toxocara canis]